MITRSTSACLAQTFASARTFLATRARGVCALGTVAAGLLLAPTTAQSQTTPTVFVANYGIGTISTYTTTGTLLNANFITGLSGPTNITISGNDLYVSNSGNNTIGKYSTSGGTQNTPSQTFSTGLSQPRGTVISGSNLFVANLGTSPNNIVSLPLSGGSPTTVTTTGSGANGLALSGSSLFVSIAFDQVLSKYSTSGTPDSGFGTGGSFGGFGAGPGALAVYGSSLYVAFGVNNNIRTFDLASGASQTTLSGLSSPTGLSVFGTNLFVLNEGNGSTTGSLGYFDLTNNAYTTLVSSLSGHAYGIAVANVSAIPEPSTYAAMAGVAALGLALWNKRRNKIAVAAK